MELVVWTYAYAAEEHPKESEALLGEVNPILQEIREHCRLFGRPTTRLSASDSVFVNRRFAVMDLDAAAARLEQVSLQGDPEFDLCYPLILRERAVLARWNERWSESAKWLDQSRQAQEHAEALAQDALTEATRLQFVRTRLDIASAALMLELERGTPERAAGALEEYDQTRRGTALGTAEQRARWACNGVFLRMRYLHAIGDQGGIQRAFLEAQDDPEVEPLRASTPVPPIWGKLKARAAMAGARLAESRGDAEQLVAALEALDDVVALVATGSGEWFWIQIRRAAVCNDLGRPAQALETLQQTATQLPRGQDFKELAQAIAAQRARALLQSPDSGPSAEDRACLEQLRAEWGILLEDWAAEDRLAEGAGVLWFQEQRDLVESLLRLWIRVDGPEQGARRALGELMRLHAQGSLARELHAPAVSVDEVQAELTVDGRGALLYFLGHEYLHVFTLDGVGPGYHPVQMREAQVRASLQALQSAVARVRRGANDERQLQEARAAVSELLLPADVQGQLASWSSVLVIGIEMLGYVPFEYLLDETGHALGARRPVSHAPSLAIALELHRRRPEPLHREALRVVGAVCPSPAQSQSSEIATALPSLPYGAAERDKLRRAVPQGAATWIEGPKVTVGALRSALTGPVHALQLLAHGGRAPGGGAGRAILLDQGDYLDRARIEALPLPPLVAFDVCGAGAGLLRPGDDGRGRLWGASLISGAVAVSLPVLDVDYGITLELRSLVHEGLMGRAVSLEEAWRDARRTLCEKLPPGVHEIEVFLHQVYGAGWTTLLVEPAPMPRAPAPWRIGALAGCALALGWAVRAGWRRRTR